MLTSSVMRILNSQGDTQVMWDFVAATEGDMQAAQAVEEAERIFREQRARGSTAFKFNYPHRTIERLSEFDPQARDILIVPRVIGG